MAALLNRRFARPFCQIFAMTMLRFSDLCAQGKARGQRVFIRADLNVPLGANGHITEDTRIRASLAASYTPLMPPPIGRVYEHVVAVSVVK